MSAALGNGVAGANLHGLRATMTVWLAAHVRDRLFADGRALQPLETGGVLLGWRDGPDCIVVDVLGPGPRALHGRHLFLPDHPWQVAHIRRAFERTHGDLDYLGDWHTHPFGVAEMSGQDDRTLRRLDRQVAGAVMVIAAGAHDRWHLGGWSLHRNGLFRRAEPIGRHLRLFSAPSTWPRAPVEP